MPIGNLDRRITIQQWEPADGSGVDSFGQPAGAWTTVATVWASMRTKSGGEGFNGEQRVASQVTIFRIRYRAGLTPRMRVVYDGSTYNVSDIAEFERRRWLDLTCDGKEVESGGAS